MAILAKASHAPRSLQLPPSDDVQQRWQVSFFSVLSKALALELFLKEANRAHLRRCPEQ